MKKIEQFEKAFNELQRAFGTPTVRDGACFETRKLKSLSVPVIPLTSF